jgi:hypothetical protein
MIWEGCFKANPEKVAFSLFCRLITARESPDASEVSEETLQLFDARKYIIFRSLLVLKLEEGEFVARSHYINFMEWFLCSSPDQPLISKILRIWDLLGVSDIPFAGYPISSSHVALKHHWEIMCRENVVGRYCFRFSNKKGHLTVDFTCFLGPNGVYSETGRTVSVASRRLEVVSLKEENTLFRVDMAGPSERSENGENGQTSWGTVPEQPVDFPDPASFIRAWGSRLKIKCETTQFLDRFVLRWTPS